MTAACPTCGSTYGRIWGSVSTLMTPSVYRVGEEMHVHDPNSISEQVTCGQGHRYTWVWFYQCPACPWEGGTAHAVALEPRTDTIDGEEV